MRATRRTLDVSGLPDFAFGPQGMIWWGTVGYMVIEGSMFVMALIAYFVFRTRVPEWPPALANPPLAASRPLPPYTPDSDARAS